MTKDKLCIFTTVVLASFIQSNASAGNGGRLLRMATGSNKVLRSRGFTTPSVINLIQHPVLGSNTGLSDHNAFALSVKHPEMSEEKKILLVVLNGMIVGARNGFLGKQPEQDPRKRIQQLGQMLWSKLKNKKNVVYLIQEYPSYEGYGLKESLEEASGKRLDMVSQNTVTSRSVLAFIFEPNLDLSAEPLAGPIALDQLPSTYSSATSKQAEDLLRDRPEFKTVVENGEERINQATRSLGMMINGIRVINSHLLWNQVDPDFHNKLSRGFSETVAQSPDNTIVLGDFNFPLTGGGPKQVQPVKLNGIQMGISPLGSLNDSGKTETTDGFIGSKNLIIDLGSLHTPEENQAEKHF